MAPQTDSLPSDLRTDANRSGWGTWDGNVLGYRPTCDCQDKLNARAWAHDHASQELHPAPGWCLDPFAGTFTTGEVCAELGVNAIGLDISLEYLDEHAKPRIGLTPAGALDDLPLFASLEAHP